MNKSVYDGEEHCPECLLERKALRLKGLPRLGQAGSPGDNRLKVQFGHWVERFGFARYSRECLSALKNVDRNEGGTTEFFRPLERKNSFCFYYV